jgi:hypothetical protein
LWHHLRDQELWWPWFDQRRACAKTSAPRIEPDRLHARAVAMLKQPRNYRPTWQALLSYPLALQIRQLAVRTLVVYREADVFAVAQSRQATLLADDEADAARLLERWFLNTDRDADTASRAAATRRAGQAHDPA